MNSSDLRDKLISYPGSTEEEPFGPEVYVYKVMGKMYALSTYENPLSVNLKCDPVRSEELRNEHVEIDPGYHMSKKHWNTLRLNGALSDELTLELIDHSYNLVVKSLTKKMKLELETLKNTPAPDQTTNMRNEFLREI